MAKSTGPLQAMGLLLVVGFVACYDAPRDNPVDPALTPAVELSVALDDTAGTVTLTWTQYAGQQPFREYRVLRNIVDRRSVDTLIHIPAVEQTAFVDTTLAPNTAYVYRVVVVNAGGYDAPSEEKSVAGYAAGAVEVVEVEVDEQRGEAQLRWTQYTGARFQEYRVERRRVEEDSFAVIQQIANLSDTAWVDEDLAPETPYVYRVVVEAAGQDWASSSSGRQEFSLAPVQLWPREGGPNRLQGTLRLVWRQFRGPDFEAYQVWRRESGADVEQELGTLTDVQDTTLVDSTLQHGVEYVYRVVVKAAGTELSSDDREYRLDLPAVRDVRADFQSATASAALSWSGYAGPRFRAYQVVRRTAELAPQVVAEIPDRAARSYVDTGLVGNTEYFYRVVAVTTRDEKVEGEEVSGSFHDLVAAWPLEVEEDEYVRLYWEEDRLAALVAGGQRVRLLFFDPQGTLLGEQVLLDHPSLNIDPRSVATALNEERWLSLKMGEPFVDREVRIGLLRFGLDGSLVRQEQEVFVDSLPLLRGPEGIVEGEILLSGYAGTFDEVRVFRGEQVLFADDFENGDLGEWDFVSFNAFVAEGRLGGGGIRGSGITVAKWGESWQDFRLEADLVFGNGTRNNGRIGIGTSGLFTQQQNSSFYLQLGRSQPALLGWSFVPPSGSGLKVRNEGFSAPFAVFPGLPYRLGLGVAEGRVSASVASPAFWTAPGDVRVPYTSLVAAGEKLALTAGVQPYLINPVRSDSIAGLLESPVSEMRLWGEGGTVQRMGICLPQSHQVLTGFTSTNNEQLIWPFSTSAGITSLGTRQVGQGGGDFFYPLSFDAGPDRRLFVLDAGNARIQVFNLRVNYITQWGRKGSAEGEFDFGSGRVPEDFFGSVAVDGEGYIYVADVGNKRIQKFAP